MSSARQRVTIVAEQSNGRNLRLRRSTAPEEKLTAIQNALGITAKTGMLDKICVAPETSIPRRPQLKNSHLAFYMLQCGLKEQSFPS